MTGRIDGKVALVTGAGSGLGRSIVQRFAAEGACVVAVDCSGTEADTVAAIGSDDVVACHADVSVEAHVDTAIAETRRRWGRLDIICNVAAISGPYDTPVADVPIEAFDRVFAVNVRGPFLVMRAGIPLMLENTGGSIVNVGSTCSFITLPGVSSYTMSKGALLQLTRATAIDYARRGIRANVLCPGGIETPMHDELSAEENARRRGAIPMGRRADVEEITAVALFLASDESSFVTGAAYVADGGFTAI